MTGATEEIKSFRDLRVWQVGIELVERVYHLTQCFPRSETYGLTSQMRRAAVSIPSNIAEGHTREHLREYLHHISVAQASLAELQTQVEIATRLGYLSYEQEADLVAQCSPLAKQLYSLRNALATRLRASAPARPQHPTPNTQHRRSKSSGE